MSPCLKKMMKKCKMIAGWFLKNLIFTNKIILEIDKMRNINIRAEHITKDYPGTRALDDISISFASGKVNALVGKNGSGKSTLIKIFSGAVKPTSGEIFLNEKRPSFQ